MDDSEALLVYGVYICAMFLQQNGEIDVAPEDCIVNAGESLIILAIEPVSFALCCISEWLLYRILVVFLEEVLKSFMVVIVGGHMEYGGVLSVYDGVDAFDVVPKEFLRVLLVKALDSLE